MFRILHKQALTDQIYLMNIEAPRVARSAQPGQFIILRIDEQGERVPLTIADYNAEKGYVTIVTQTVGYSTGKLCALNEGDCIADFAGPLGRPSEFIHTDPETLRHKKILFISPLFSMPLSCRAAYQPLRHNKSDECPPPCSCCLHRCASFTALLWKLHESSLSKQFPTVYSGRL